MADKKISDLPAGGGINDATLFEGEQPGHTPASRQYTALQIANYLGALTPAAHTHPISDITGLQAALNAKGSGDMLASIYDPTGVAADAFDMDNMVEGATTKIFTDTERTKLAGIEDGAEVNDSAAEILAKLVTVDGPGSGLDADTLDGQSSAAFAVAAHTHTLADVTDAGDAAAAGVKESVEIDAGDIHLVGDTSAPGNNKVYGTDGAGVRGWKDDPAGGAGDVVGPAGATDGHAVLFDGATGKLLKSAGWAPQQSSALLAAIAALTPTDGIFIVGDGSTFVSESGTTVRTSLGLGTAHSPQFTGIELGHATDTTITRASAGRIAVEGVNVVTTSSVDTLTNKTLSGLDGTYTPTATAEVNCTATPNLARWMRIGNTVTVSGQIVIDPVAAGAVSFELSLPVASSFSTSLQCAGVGSDVTESLRVASNSANDTAAFSYTAVGTGATNWMYIYSYTVI